MQFNYWAVTGVFAALVFLSLCAAPLRLFVNRERWARRGADNAANRSLAISRLRGPLVVAATVGSLQAVAADATSGSPADHVSKLEEVIVTAQRREENAQTVPISMTVLSNSEIQQNNVGTLNQIQYLVPSLSVIPNGYSETVTLNIRGQGNAYGGTQPSVLAYLNEVPLPAVSTGSYGGPGLFFDLQNVEVLKGPQGTLFGRNAVGGALLLQTAKPRNDFGGNLQLTYGNYNDREADGAINLPLVSDVFLFRLAFDVQKRDGYSHILSEPSRPNGIDGDNRDSKAFRGTVAFRPAAWFENEAVFGYADYDQVGSPGRLAGVAAGTAAVYPSLPSMFAQQQALPTRTFLPINNDDISKGKLLSASNTTRVDLTDQLTFRNILGYESLTQQLQIDQDSTELPIFDYPVPPPPTTRAPTFAARRQFTEEAQLLGKNFNDRLTWIIGGFFLDNPGDKGPPVNGSGSARSFGTLLSQEIVQSGEWSRAVFAQGSYALTDQLKLTAGVRYTRDTVRQVTFGNLLDSVCNGPTLVDCGPASGLRNEAATNALTWTAGLDYQITPDTLLYLASHRGYRGGGFNAPTQGISPPPFEPEYVTDGEFGVKSDWNAAGLAIRTNAALWYEKYEGIQLVADIPEPITPQNPSGYIAYTINAGEGKLYGLEFEGQANLTHNFQIGLTYSYTHRGYTSFSPFVPAATVADLKASETLGAPRSKYGLRARYFLPFPGNLGDVSAAANWNWQSSSGDTSVPNGLGMIPSFGLLNLSAEWKGIYGKPLDLSLFATNVLNKTYINDAVPFWQPGFWGGSLFYGEPRMYGVRLKYRFGTESK